MQQEKTNPGGEKELAQGWAAAVATLDHWVEKTYNQAVRVSEMAHGPNRVLEVHTFLGDMSQARGALVIMKVIRGDEDPQLEDLMARLNHCPLVMVAGPSIGKKPTPEAQQLRLHLVQ